MKIATLIFFFIFTQAFAADCSPFQEEVYQNLGSENKIRSFSSDHQWTAFQKQLIHKTVEAVEPWRGRISQQAALKIFGDKDNAGEFSYYRIGNWLIASVIYYPGFHENGVVFEVQKGD